MNFDPSQFPFDHPISLLIQQRTSVRTYSGNPVPEELLDQLGQFLKFCDQGPLHNRVRIQMTAAEEEDAQNLKGLGTYGFIKNPAGFLIGAVQKGPGTLEDFGYLMEAAILRATDLGLGTCWLGGTFQRSRFSRQIKLRKEEILPSVVSFGMEADQPRALDAAVRQTAGSDQRKPWSALFFKDDWGTPLPPEEAGSFRTPLEMLRLAPSASNKQPWRILIQGQRVHFFLQRTANYPSAVWKTLLGIADLQRVDLGIAMSHFELTALQEGLKGSWMKLDSPPLPDEHSPEYLISWKVSGEKRTQVKN